MRVFVNAYVSEGRRGCGEGAGGGRRAGRISWAQDLARRLHWFSAP